MWHELLSKSIQVKCLPSDVRQNLQKKNIALHPIISLQSPSCKVFLNVWKEQFHTFFMKKLETFIKFENAMGPLHPLKIEI